MSKDSKVLKLTVLGAGGVGKSSLTNAVCGGQFNPGYDPTIEDMYRMTFTADGINRVVDILDTAGQDEFISMLDQWLREGDGFLLVYSITQRDSFTHVKDLIEKLSRTKGAAAKTPIVLVGNKCDLEAQREVKEEEASAFAKSLKIPFFEASALTKTNSMTCFVELVKIMFQGSSTTTTKPTKKKCFFL